MSWLGDVFKFEQFNLGNQWDKLKKNPERAFIGAMDEGGTKVWNKAFDIGGINRNYEPMTDWFGGASKDSYTKASDAGINTGPGRSMHNVAKAVTAYYAGGYGADKLGAAYGGGGEAINPATGTGWSETGSGFAGNGGYGTGESAGGAGDVWAGWSPTGSSAGNGLNSGYTPEQQASLDKLIATQSDKYPMDGKATAGLGKKQLMAQALRGMGSMGGQQPQQTQIEIIKEQPDFQQVAQQAPIQEQGYANTNPYILFGDDEKKRLAQALRES